MVMKLLLSLLYLTQMITVLLLHVWMSVLYIPMLLHVMKLVVRTHLNASIYSLIGSVQTSIMISMVVS
jgi:hypothetical protein